jgi:hypothetical protein
MHTKPFLLAAVVSILAGSASAGVITYDVTVNTFSLSGTAGSLDFQFNPGSLVSQAANLQILSFSSAGSLSACGANVQGFCATGDVTGTLPGTLTFDNGAVFNDYFDDFTFGSTLSFEVSLFGPALSAPDGISTSGSVFAFSMFSDAAGTVPALTTDQVNGFATTINVGLDGTTTVTDLSSQTTVTPAASAVPEPSSLALLGTVMLLAIYLQRRRAVRTDS